MSMMNTKKENFNWDKLLKRIAKKNVIPVIGHGLYWIEKERKEEVLLYDYLTKKILEDKEIQPPTRSTHQFLKVSFEFLRKHKEYLVLSECLNDLVKEEILIAANPLWKLARIKAFKLFINTSYDDFLVNTIKTVRDYPTTAIHYTLKDKNLNKLNDRLFDALDSHKKTLVYNIFGNFGENGSVTPAYTERDILETIVEFQRDMKENPGNNLFQQLESSSLLFMGCGYDDWLFRFFIRTVANEPFQHPTDPQALKFVEDYRFINEKDSCEDLTSFLKNYDSEIYFSKCGKDFVDILFEKMEKAYPNVIIPESDFPCNVFISFEGSDRPAAARLAKHLREDGIQVWLDEDKLKGGDPVDKTIIAAINKCKVFIPLISKNSETVHADDGKLKYHCREWERAYTNHISNQNPRIIIPVKLSEINWLYEKFEDKIFYTIPNGQRNGDYEKLKNRLLDEQRKIAD
jgi:hypothetical protein